MLTLNTRFVIWTELYFKDSLSYNIQLFSFKEYNRMPFRATINTVTVASRDIFEPPQNVKKHQEI